MPVTVEWDNAQRNTLRTDSHGNWTWEEYHRAVDKTLEMMGTVDHEVHLINVRHADAIQPQGNALPHLRRVMHDLPDNHRLTIIVNANMQNRLFVRVFQQLVPLFSRTFLMAPSLDAARKIIANYERRRADNEARTG